MKDKRKVNKFHRKNFGGCPLCMAVFKSKRDAATHVCKKVRKDE